MVRGSFFGFQEKKCPVDNWRTLSYPLTQNENEFHCPQENISRLGYMPEGSSDNPHQPALQPALYTDYLLLQPCNLPYIQPTSSCILATCPIYRQLPPAA